MDEESDEGSLTCKTKGTSVGKLLDLAFGQFMRFHHFTSRQNAAPSLLNLFHAQLNCFMLNLIEHGISIAHKR